MTRPQFEVEGIPFLAPETHSGGSVLISRSTDGVHFLKIEIIHDPGKANTVAEEADVIRHLNAADCVTCPRLVADGTLSVDQFVASLSGEQEAVIRTSGSHDRPFLIQTFVPHKGETPLPDLVMALLEQQRLGVYHGDLKPDNLRFDDTTGICYLVDYDQAEYLEPEVMDLDNIAFLRWCDARARERYRAFNFKTFLHYFPGLEFDAHLLPLFRNGAFNIGLTSVFRRQQTTLAPCGIYHRLATDRLFAEGERDLTSRRLMLDRIRFDDGEAVLDVGCNAGLLSLYLAERGCAVTGIDVDRSIVYGARMISHCLQQDVRYACLDLDAGEIPGRYETIMLFSVLHHTRNLRANSARIAESCHRIIIECRLEEQGAMPGQGGWSATSAWRFASLTDLVTGLERIFPGFALRENHGQVDRGRYVLELTDEAYPST